MKYIVGFGPLVFGHLQKCSDVARQVFCHYYLPPCGNSSVFELPTSICRETCQILQETCGEDWDIAITAFQQNPFVIREEIDFIVCEDPGKPLSPLPYSCTPFEIIICRFAIMCIAILKMHYCPLWVCCVFWFSYSTVIPTANTTSANNERNGAMFAAIPAGGIIITLAIVTTLVFVLKMKSKSHFPTPHLETR